MKEPKNETRKKEGRGKFVESLVNINKEQFQTCCFSYHKKWRKERSLKGHPKKRTCGGGEAGERQGG